MRIFLALLLLCASCNSSGGESLVSHKICGRDAAHPWIYRIKAPSSWEPGIIDDSLADTTKEICAFTIDGEIKITIHNFPSESLEQRIPPAAQISRWKRQFTHLDLPSLTTIPQTFSGFVGFLFEAKGSLNGKEQAVLGWSMQLAPQHYRMLTALAPAHLQDLRSDVTIKVVGPQELVEQHREEIVRFARSFELIEAIPSKT